MTEAEIRKRLTDALYRDRGMLNGVERDVNAVMPVVMALGTAGEVGARPDAAESATAGATGWRPIATAPKTGESILVASQRLRPSIAAWREYRPPGPFHGTLDQICEQMTKRPEGWMIEGYVWPVDPTHWMPLPELPRAAGGSDG